MPVPLSIALIWPLLAPSGHLTALAPADPPPKSESAAPAPTDTADEATPPLDDYGEQAPLDVATLLSDTSRPYLLARARLEAHPTIAAEAILDRLSAVPPPTGTDRKRLLDVLAALGLSDHVQLFATELRRAVLRTDSLTEQGKALGRWLPLLVEQGPMAVAPLTALVADKALPLSARTSLLDALVDVTPSTDLAALIPLVGRGAKPLRQQLHRSLAGRAKRDDATRQALADTIDAAFPGSAPSQHPALLRLRAALATAQDTTFARDLETLANNDEAPFTIQIAAVRALASVPVPEARTALAAIADHALTAPQRGTQRGELLAWAALQGLPHEDAQRIAQAHELARDGAPRLAVLGLTHANLANDQQWLAPALGNPWPQVRLAALDRVQGPCPTATARLLGQKAHLAGRKSEDDRAVARGAITALGRCSAGDRLADLVADEDLDVELRGEAARQLARLGDDDSINAIGRVLRRHPDRILARRLASALRHMPHPTAAGDAVLCEAGQRTDEAGHVARESLRRLHPDLSGICE